MFELSFLSILGLTVVVGFLILALAKPTELRKYLKLKNYQYEVTLGLYLFSPTEIFIFNSILFLTLTLLMIAACVYLPEHISIISKRVFYYCFGDSDLSGSLHALSSSIIETASEVFRQNASAAVESVSHAAKEAGRRSSGAAAADILGN